MADSLESFIALWRIPLWQTLAVSAMLLTAFYGCGKLVVRWHFPREQLIAFALGSALFMTLFSLLPQHKSLLFAVALPFSLWGIRELYPAVRENLRLASFMALLFLFFLGSALLIPYSWDEQTYQLALPLRWLQAGNFLPFSDNPYSFYPAFASRFFTNAIFTGGIELPRIIVGAVTPVLLAGVWRMTSRAGKMPAVFALISLFLSPLILNMNRAVYVENVIALFTMGALFAAWKLRRKGLYAPIISGILSGAALAVKPTALLGVIPVLFIILFTMKKWRSFAFFCGTAFIFSFFWYLRTFLYTGNFFYPYALFPAPGSVEHFHHILGSARYGLEGVTGALLNWLFAGFDKKLFDGIVLGFQIPLLGAAGAIGLYLYAKRHPRCIFLAATLLSAFLLVLLLWSVLFPQSRFLLVLLPFAAAGGVLTLARTPWRKIAFTLLGAVLLCTFFFQSKPFLYHYLVSWRILTPVMTAPTRALPHLTRDPGLFRAFGYLARNTPPGARCLLLMERRGLYCPRPYTIACPGFEPSLTPVPETPEKLFEKLRSFDYIIVGNTTQDVDLQSANAEECKKVFSHLRELLERGKVKMLDSSGYAVLQIIK